MKVYTSFILSWGWSPGHPRRSFPLCLLELGGLCGSQQNQEQSWAAAFAHSLLGTSQHGCERLDTSPEHALAVSVPIKMSQFNLQKQPVSSELPQLDAIGFWTQRCFKSSAHIPPPASPIQTLLPCRISPSSSQATALPQELQPLICDWNIGLL